MAMWECFNYHELAPAIADARVVLSEFGNVPVKCEAKMNPVGGEIAFGAEFDNRYNAIAYAELLKAKFATNSRPFTVRKVSTYKVIFKKKG